MWRFSRLLQFYHCTVTVIKLFASSATAKMQVNAAMTVDSNRVCLFPFLPVRSCTLTPTRCLGLIEWLDLYLLEVFLSPWKCRKRARRHQTPNSINCWSNPYPNSVFRPIWCLFMHFQLCFQPSPLHVREHSFLKNSIQCGSRPVSSLCIILSHGSSWSISKQEKNRCEVF